MPDGMNRNQRAAARPGEFRLDHRPLSAKAILRAARIAMVWLMVLSSIPSFGRAAAGAFNLKDLKRNARAGDAISQYPIGRLYEDGDMVPRSSGKAVRWYRKAALQNFASAQHRLGLMYADGRGVGRDFDQARYWLVRAAAQGHAVSQNRLGVMYERGEGVVQDFAEAYKWFSLAVGQNQKVFAMANREALLRRMTPDQVAEGQRRAESNQSLVARAIRGPGGPD